MADERLGASFTIDVNNLKAGLKTANKLIRESQAEFRAAAAGLDKYSDAQKIAQAKIKSLNDIIPQQQNKVDALKKQYEKLKNSVDANGKAFDETSDRAIELRTQIAREEAALKENKAELDKQTKALNELDKSGGDAARAIEDVGDETTKTTGAFTVMKGALANLVADGFRIAISKAKEFASAIVEVGISFDDSMAQVAAVSGATGKELDTLREKAKEMGSSTKFTASEAADAFNYMAMAGWKTEQMIGGIDGILNLAAASGSDLATTSDIVTDALTAMGYAAEDAGRLADVMAAASSNANTNVEMMGQTFQYAAPLVGALGYSMEDTAVAIGLMANAGIKGEKAGTSLRAVMSRLSAPPTECANAMEALNIQLTHADGTMKPLQEIINDLRKAFDGMSESEKTANAKHIAGQEAMSGLLAIVNAAPEDFNKLTSAVENSEGAAQKMADTMLDTLGGDMTVLKSQIEGVQLTIFEKLSPTLRSGVKDAQNFINKVDWTKFGKKAGDAISKVATMGKNFAKNVLPTMTTALKVAGGALKLLIDNFGWLAPAVLTAVTAFKAFKAVMAVTTAITAAKTAVAGLTAGVGLATKAQAVWNATMAANPIGAVLTAVGFLAAGIALLTANTKKATEEEEKQNEKLKELYSTVNDNVESYKNLAQQQQSFVDQGFSELAYYQNLKTELDNIVDKNGKIKEGYEKRAAFIVDTLSEATGIEISLIDGTISKYGELSKSIDNIIEKKRAEILLDSQKEMYSEAFQKRNEGLQTQFDLLLTLTEKESAYNAEKEKVEEAEKRRDNATTRRTRRAANLAVSNAKKKEKAAKDEYDAAKKAYDDQTNLLQTYAYNIGIYEKNLALAHDGEYDKMITTTWNYVSQYEDAENATRQMVVDSIKFEQSNLDMLRGLKEKYNTDIYDSQIAAGENNLNELHKQLAAYNKATETSLGENQVIWSDAMAANLSEITGKNIEFQDAGNGLVQMLVDGEKIGAPRSKEEMAQIASDAVNEITKKEPDAKTAGENLIDGINNGISNEKKQNGVFSKIAAFGSKLLDKLKKSLQENSPSKATREMGQFLLDGIGLGIKGKEKAIYNQATRFGKNVVKSIQEQINGFNGTSILNSVKGQVNAIQRAYDFDGVMTGGANVNPVGSSSVSGNGSKSVVVNQYNTYSQAHSRYEIYKSKQQTAAAVRLALGMV